MLIPALLVAGCAKGGSGNAAPERGDDLRPTFPAVTSAPGVVETAPTVTTTPSAAAPAAGAPTTVAVATSQAASAAAGDEPVKATITDRVGDLTVSLDPPPKWADLAGGTLTRTNAGFELRVKLAGGAAPTATDADHTMNIASFYDVDGDGQIDYEVWANVSDGGWGGSYFDNTKGAARFGDDAGVSWTPEGDAVVFRFPLSHLGNASRFRWSLASEWGRYEVLTTPASARDDAPDDDQPANFG